MIRFDAKHSQFNLGHALAFLPSIAAAIILQLVTISSASATGGLDAGGSGGAWVCEDKNTGAFDVQLVDLFEAEAVGLSIHPSNKTSADAQFLDAMKRLEEIEPELAKESLTHWKYIKKNLRGGPQVEVDVPKDINKKFSKAGCELKGMMYFDGTRKVLIRNTTIYDAQKTQTDFAASLAHEAIYKALREREVSGGKDLVMTRVLVGCLFADAEVGACLNLERFQIPSTGKRWECSLPATAYGSLHFYLRFDNFSNSWIATIRKWGSVEAKFLNEISFGTSMVRLYRRDLSNEGMVGYFIRRAGGVVGLESVGAPFFAELPQLTVKSLAPFRAYTDENQGKELSCRELP